jgi:flagellin-like protein
MYKFKNRGNFKLRINRLNLKNKKAISNLVGYVLLMVFVIVLAGIVYNWMKTYVPKDKLECPDEVSILVNDYNCTTSELTLVLKNNGRFNIGGYFIYATNSPEAQLATIDLSHSITSGETPMNPNGIKFLGEGNSFLPNYEETHKFDVSSISPRIYSIEIVPMRWQEQARKQRLVTCTNAKMRKSIDCS